MRMNHLLIILFMVIGTVVAGCDGAKDQDQEVPIGDLILNQEKITSVQITEVEGNSNLSRITLTDPSDIDSMIAMVKDIPLKRLTFEEEQAFMPTRIMEKHLTIAFDDNMNPNRIMQGGVFMWPDGYIWASDLGSMLSSARTGSYLTKSTYPEIYNRIYAKTGH